MIVIRRAPRVRSEGKVIVAQLLRNIGNRRVSPDPRPQLNGRQLDSECATQNVSMCMKRQHYILECTKKIHGYYVYRGRLLRYLAIVVHAHLVLRLRA